MGFIFLVQGCHLNSMPGLSTLKYVISMSTSFPSNYHCRLLSWWRRGNQVATTHHTISFVFLFESHHERHCLVESSRQVGRILDSASHKSDTFRNLRPFSVFTEVFATDTGSLKREKARFAAFSPEKRGLSGWNTTGASPCQPKVVSGSRASTRTWGRPGFMQ